MKKRKLGVLIVVTITLVMIFTINVFAAPGISITDGGITISGSDDPVEIANSVKLLLILTVITLLPSILIMMTSFTRVIIVLSFIRNAMGTQQIPPNQVLIGLALFITFFIMSPVLTQINDQALQPFINNEIKIEQAMDIATDSIRDFMIKQTREKDLAMFVGMSGMDAPKEPSDIPLRVMIPAFMISEITKAFWMGFVLYIPFLVIDMVVASTLMSMGMMMLPPVMISLPFKILLFILVDGWNLIIGNVVQSFNF